MKAYLGPSSPSSMPPSERSWGGWRGSWGAGTELGGGNMPWTPFPPTHSKASFYREVAPQASCSFTYTFKVPSS